MTALRVLSGRALLFLDHPELLRAFRAGDASALERTYYEYVDLVSAVVRRQTRGSADHPDLVQEIFIRAFAERGRLAYDGLRPYKPLLLTIARNLIVDWARKAGREATVDVDIEAASSGSESAEPIDPLLSARVDAYLAGLDVSLRSVYEQRYVHGASQEDAAKALGLTRQKVRTLEQQLREGLQKALQ